jgi:hypothetical protein
MKKKFLTVYDYGTGGVWQYIYAESKEQLERKFPEIEVLESLPAWWAERPINVKREYDIDGELDEFMSLMTKQKEKYQEQNK